MYIGLRVKWPLFLSDLGLDFKFLYRISKNQQISNAMKTRPAGAELFNADGRTDMTKLIPAFRNFANAPEKEATWAKTAVEKWRKFKYRSLNMIRA